MFYQRVDLFSLYKKGFYFSTCPLSVKTDGQVEFVSHLPTLVSVIFNFRHKPNTLNCQFFFTKNGQPWLSMKDGQNSVTA